MPTLGTAMHKTTNRIPTTRTSITTMPMSTMTLTTMPTSTPLIPTMGMTPRTVVLSRKSRA
jgi:hypothetical protein